MDVDLVCELTEDRTTAFIDSFDDEFYISASAVQDAVRRKSCFNLIHMPTSFKVDVFVSRGRPFDIEAMRRACAQRLGDERTLEVPIASAEDSIVSKLEWYRNTNQTSDRQWDDVSRLLRLLGESVDFEYLKQAARSVDVSELLETLLRQTTQD